MTQSHQKMGFHRPHGRVQVEFPEQTRTKQSFAKECDINEILKQFRRTGMINHVAKHQGYYGDFTNGVTYQGAMQVIAEANSMFESLPAHVRAEFENDPAKFLDFVHDESNEERMKELGLIDPKVKPEEGRMRPPAPPEPPVDEIEKSRQEAFDSDLEGE